MHRQLLDSIPSARQGWPKAAVYASPPGLEQQVLRQLALAVAAEHAIFVRACGCAMHALCSPGVQAGSTPCVPPGAGPAAWRPRKQAAASHAVSTSGFWPGKGVWTPVFSRCWDQQLLPLLPGLQTTDPFLCCSVDPFSRKDWYDVKAPSVFNTRNVGKTLVTRTQGTKVSLTPLVWQRSAGGGQRQVGGSRGFREARQGCWAVQPQACCSSLLAGICAALCVQAGLFAVVTVASCLMVRGLQLPAQLICMHAHA